MASYNSQILEFFKKVFFSMYYYYNKSLVQINFSNIYF